jgi:DNA-binding IclR family transcriptional regulator
MKLVEVPVVTPNNGVMCNSELVILMAMNGKMYTITQVSQLSGYNYNTVKLGLNRLASRGLVKLYKKQYGTGTHLRIGRDSYYQKVG